MRHRESRRVASSRGVAYIYLLNTLFGTHTSTLTHTGAHARTFCCTCFYYFRFINHTPCCTRAQKCLGPRTASREPWPEAFKVIISSVFSSKSFPVSAAAAAAALYFPFLFVFSATNLMKRTSLRPYFGLVLAVSTGPVHIAKKKKRKQNVGGGKSFHTLHTTTWKSQSGPVSLLLAP